MKFKGLVLVLVCMLTGVTALQVYAVTPTSYTNKDGGGIILKNEFQVRQQIDMIKQQALNKSMISGDDANRTHVVFGRDPKGSMWVLVWFRTNKLEIGALSETKFKETMLNNFGGYTHFNSFWIPSPPNN